MKAMLAAAMVLQGASGLSSNDLMRAKTPRPTPGSHVHGATPRLAFEKMNAALRGSGVRTRRCEDFDHKGLNTVARALYEKRSPELNVIYAERKDKRAMHFGDFSYKAALWAQEAADPTARPGTAAWNTTRDGKCAEAVNWWTHHLTDAARSELSAQPGFVVPEMPAEVASQETASSEYSNQLSCLSCHTTGGLNWTNNTSAPRADYMPGTCDGNPHGWDRTRRCDAANDACPNASWLGNCGVCEGIGGIPGSDKNEDMVVPKCDVMHTAAEMAALGISPTVPKFETRFQNFGFHEVQIFVKHDPFCIAQIPAAVSNGTHCYKPQEGTFNYDEPSGKLRIDYLRSETPFKGVNMTEYFYHEGTCVHPHITQYGPLGTSEACPCINVTVGIVTSNWAGNAQYIGRAMFEAEYLGLGQRTVDHWIKGPHHAFVDVATGNIMRMWQPFNGLEIFHPNKWVKNPPVSPEWTKTFKLPLACELENALCIQAKI